MILNISRLKTQQMCTRAAFNRYHRNLDCQRSMNLVDGSAFHKAVAHGQATKDWDDALKVSKATFDEDVKKAGFSEDETFLTNIHWRVCTRMVELYRDNWKDIGMEVIQPECEFRVDIPGTEHYDITMHWRDDRTGLEHWGMPTVEAILARAVRSPHAPNTWSRVRYDDLHRHNPNCPCYRPHKLVGKTDGIMAWQGHFWLQEHKTTAIKDDRFWKQWHLDNQLTGYIYGVGKATGMTPKGVILNAIYKPSESQIAAWNSKRKDPATAKDVTHYMEYMRDIFMRTPEDLARFERDFIDCCDEWEWRILGGRFPLMPIHGHCQAYNRQCDFYDLCVNHDDEQYLELFTTREPDYVDSERVELINIAKIKEHVTCT